MSRLGHKQIKDRENPRRYAKGGSRVVVDEGMTDGQIDMILRSLKREEEAWLV